MTSQSASRAGKVVDREALSRNEKVLSDGESDDTPDFNGRVVSKVAVR